MRVEEVVTGETYMIRYWDEMESEFGSKTECGCMMIDTPDGPNFVSGMKNISGTLVMVSDVYHPINEIETKPYLGWSISSYMLSPLDKLKDQKIDINTFVKGVLKL
jgi:hypothetical protein